jgi:ATP-dependent Lhr-like helicase
MMGAPLDDEERADKLARVLLARYGVLTRECLEHEEGTGDWALLYPVLQRMEMRGEIRRGYFVAGLSGIQFALPAAVEKLRAPESDAMIVLNATDPANLFGAELPDVPIRFARHASTHVVVWRGQPILAAENSGEHILAAPDAAPDLIRRALEAYLARPATRRHLLVTQWNGAGVHGSPAEALLQSLDFHRTPKGMEK